MLRIAIISDIHGNLPALQAVLRDIDSFQADQLYCLGDLTDAAPWHNEVIELIRNLRIPTIMGNHDERIAFDYPVLALDKHSKAEQEARKAAINFTKQTITAKNKEYLAGLPGSIKISRGKLQLILAHGSPENNEEYLYGDHDEKDLLNLLSENAGNVLIAGHTHLSYIRKLQAGDKLVINAGSVGRSKEPDRRAVYLQLMISNTLNGHLTDIVQANIRKVDYPVHETISAIEKSEIPDFYAEFLRNKHE